MQGLLDTLGIKGPVLLLQMIGFGVLFLLLRRFLFGPVGGMLRARQEEVEAGLKAAEEAQAESARLRQERQLILAQARDEGRGLVQKAVREAEEAKQRVMAEGQTEREALLDKARGIIEMERNQVVIELRKEVGELAIQAAAHAIRQATDDPAHRQAIDTFITDVERQSGSAVR